MPEPRSSTVTIGLHQRVEPGVWLYARVRGVSPATRASPWLCCLVDTGCNLTLIPGAMIPCAMEAGDLVPHMPPDLKRHAYEQAPRQMSGTPLPCRGFIGHLELTDDPRSSEARWTSQWVVPEDEGLELWAPKLDAKSLERVKKDWRKAPSKPSYDKVKLGIPADPNGVSHIVLGTNLLESCRARLVIEGRGRYELVAATLTLPTRP